MPCRLNECQLINTIVRWPWRHVGLSRLFFSSYFSACKHRWLYEGGVRLINKYMFSIVLIPMWKCNIKRVSNEQLYYRCQIVVLFWRSSDRVTNEIELNCQSWPPIYKRLRQLSPRRATHRLPCSYESCTAAYMASALVVVISSWAILTMLHPRRLHFYSRNAVLRFRVWNHSYTGSLQTVLII